MSGLLSMRPTGWFQVAWSIDVEVGDVKPLHHFGADLVMFRDNDGVAHVLDAVCPHFGADLSHGGSVVEGGIQCPLHGWVWSGDGHNVHIPYEPGPDRDRKAQCWPVTELNECIYMWHDVKRRAPQWEVPDVRQLLGEHVGDWYYRPVGTQEHELFRGIRVHPQVIVESAVDRHHFRFVHHTPVSPTVLAETADTASWHVKLGFDNHDTRKTIEIYWSGIGLSFGAEHTSDGVQVTSVCPTPVDDGATDIFVTYWVSESLNYDERLNVTKAALHDDIAIWKYQRHLDDPGLAPSEERDMTVLRSWTSGFYPQAQPMS